MLWLRAPVSKPGSAGAAYVGGLSAGRSAEAGLGPWAGLEQPLPRQGLGPWGLCAQGLAWRGFSGGPRVRRWGKRPRRWGAGEGETLELAHGQAL